MRVTNSTLMQSAQRNLQSSMSKLAELQDKATSQKAISRPSDNPIGTADSLRVRAELRATEQYGRNVSNGDGWLTTLDSAMSATVGIMNQVRDLTVQGANDGALSPAAREAVATQLESLRTDLLAQANTRYLGRMVFAGNSDAAAAFDADLTYVGAPGSTVERRIGPDTTVRVDTDGGAVFGSGADSVFALLDEIVADLRDKVNVGPRLTEIDERMATMIGQHADVGTRHAQIQRAEEALMELSGSLEAQRSGIEDIDLGRVILDLKLQEVAYQSALAVTARVLQPTLMDFLR